MFPFWPVFFRFILSLKEFLTGVKSKGSLIGFGYVESVLWVVVGKRMRTIRSENFILKASDTYHHFVSSSTNQLDEYLARIENFNYLVVPMTF